jgi:hypothetical protein
MTSLEERLTTKLEPVLESRDPRPGLSAYRSMPCAIFWYSPGDEFHLRRELKRLATRLETKGKRVYFISLAECLKQAVTEHVSLAELAVNEKDIGLDATVETLSEILDARSPLPEVIASRLPPDANPLRDIVFIVRCGSLFPVYRPYPLVEQLMGRLELPVVVFYPGELDGPTSLRFMGVLDPDNNYRPKIF